MCHLHGLLLHITSSKLDGKKVVYKIYCNNVAISRKHHLVPNNSFESGKQPVHNVSWKLGRGIILSFQVFKGKWEPERGTVCPDVLALTEHWLDLGNGALWQRSTELLLFIYFHHLFSVKVWGVRHFSSHAQEWAAEAPMLLSG